MSFADTFEIICIVLSMLSYAFFVVARDLYLGILSLYFLLLAIFVEVRRGDYGRP